MAIMIELSPERLECQEIETVLRRLRIPGTRVGQRYLAYAVQCAMLDPDLTLTKTGALYPMIADNFGVTRTGVERAMRTAVQASWERGGRATLDEIAGYHLDVRPTTFEFVDLVAAHLLRSVLP